MNDIQFTDNSKEVKKIGCLYMLCSYKDKKKPGWKECDYKQQHTLKSKHKSNKLVLYAAGATSTATSKYKKKNNTKLYPFNPNPLCTTHKQPPKNNNNKFARKKKPETFFMYFYFHFGKQISELKLKSCFMLLLCCACWWRRGAEILIFKVNFLLYFTNFSSGKAKA